MKLFSFSFLYHFNCFAFLLWLSGLWLLLLGFRLLIPIPWRWACDDQGAGWIEFLSPKNFIKLGFFHLKPPWIWRFRSSGCNLIRAAIAPSSSATLTGSALLLAGCIRCRKQLGLTAFKWWPPTDPNRIPNRIPFCWSFSIVSHGLTLDV